MFAGELLSICNAHYFYIDCIPVLDAVAFIFIFIFSSYTPNPDNVWLSLENVVVFAAAEGQPAN